MVQDFYDTAKSWGKEVVAKANPGNSISQAPGMSRLSSIARQLPSNIILRLSGFTLYPLPFKLFKAAVSLLLTAYCFLPTVLSAQGCAMCYTSAASARAGAKEALANGVLILLVPPMVFFVLIAVVVYRYRNKFRETCVVRGPLSVVRNQWFEDQDLALVIQQDYGLKHAVESAWLGEREGQRTTDHGQRTTDKQFPRAR